MRFLRYLLITIIGIAIAVGALIWEGSTLETVVFPVGDLPVVDFATLQRPPAPNQYLLCPAGMCVAQTDGTAPVFARSAEQLRVAWDEMLASEPRVEVLRRDVTNIQVDYVQRSRLLHFPDIITVRFVPVDDVQMVPDVERFAAAGIPVVVCINRMAGKVASFVGSDDVAVGYTAAKALTDGLGGSGRIVAIEGAPGAPTSRDRTLGLRKALAGAPGIALLGSGAGNFHQSPARAAIPASSRR